MSDYDRFYHCKTCGTTGIDEICCQPARTDAERWGRFVTLLAEALGVKEEWPEGFAEEHLIQAARNLQLGSLPRLMELQAKIATLEHQVLMASLTFQLIEEHPHQAAQLAASAMDRIRRAA